ncbi:MAG: tail fiber protein [Candidatus Aminicenantes bacterium]
MSEPFLGEIMIVGFNFAPRGWAMCDGQILPINQNQSLYSLLGTTYGGDGRTSFALPDLRSRTPVHEGDGISLGQKSGAETVTLTTAEMAAHTHAIKGTSAIADRGAVGGNADRGYATVPQTEPNDIIYGSPANMVSLGGGILPHAGGGQAHNNMQPYLILNYVIALQGLFPSRN